MASPQAQHRKHIRLFGLLATVPLTGLFSVLGILEYAQRGVPEVLLPSFLGIGYVLAAHVFVAAQKLKLSLSGLIFYAAFLLTVLFVGWSTVHAGRLPVFWFSAGCVLLVTATLMVMVRKLSREEGKQWYVTETAFRLPKIERDLINEWESPADRADRIEIISEFRSVALREMKAILLPHYVFLTVGTIAVGLGCLLNLNRSSTLLLIAFTLLLLQSGVCFFMNRATTLERFVFLGVVEAISALLWAVVCLLSGADQYFVFSVVTVLTSILLLLQPDMLSRAIVLGSSFVLCISLLSHAAPVAPLFILLLVISLMAIVLSYRGHVFRQQAIVARYLLHSGRLHPVTDGSIRGMLGVVTSITPGAVCIASAIRDRVECLIGGVPQRNTLEAGVLTSLIGEAKQNGFSIEKRSLSACSASVQQHLNQNLGIVPTELLLARFHVAAQPERATPIAVFIPLTSTQRLLGIDRLVEMLSAHLNILKLLWGMPATAPAAFEKVVSGERSGSAIDRSAEIAHAVNNFTQDIAVAADALQVAFKSESIDHEWGERTASDIETLARMTSSTVSDWQLLRELLGRQDAPASDKLILGPVLDEYFASIAVFARRYGIKCSFTRSVASEVGVSVAGREYFKALLRQCAFLLIRFASKSTEFQVSVEAIYPSVVITLRSARTTQMEMAEGSEERIEELRSAGHAFSIASKGEFTMVCNPAADRLIALTIPSIFVSTQFRLSNLEWLLFVDDSEETLAFYTRIAEALSVPHKTAGTLEAAEELLLNSTPPVLVVTDLHLGERSGLDLLKSIQQRYGESIPVVVVSGETDPEILNQVRSFERVVLIRKPVSRRKLFAEIQDILGSNTRSSVSTS